MADIFVSYASDDRERVAPLAEALIAHGWSVWWDRQIPPGKTFDEVIEQALDAASAVVCVWTARGVESRWVRTEAAEGLARNMLVPVLMEDVRIPLAFRRIQAADLTDWQSGEDHPGYDELISALEAIITATTEQPVPPPEPVDAVERALVGARSRAAVGDWPGVIALFGSLDADAASRAAAEPEVGELLTLARHKRDAAELYEEAELLYSEGRWQGTVAKLDRVLELDPDIDFGADLKARAERHLAAQRAERLARDHQLAAEALRDREWSVAIAHFEELLDDAPDDEAAAAGLVRARANAASEQRYRELEDLFAEKQWSEVVAGMDELSALNPNFGDPADLRARAEARAAEPGIVANVLSAGVESPIEPEVPAHTGPPPTQPEPVFVRFRAWARQRFDWRWIAAAIVVLVAVVGAVALGGGDGAEDETATTAAVAADEVPPEPVPPTVSILTMEGAPAIDPVGLEAGLGSFEDESLRFVVGTHLDGEPDIMIVPTRAASDMGAARHAVPLPPAVIEQLEADYAPWWIDEVTLDGDIYGVPIAIDKVVNLVWYSPRYFDESGYAVPGDWDELMALQTRMREAGQTPWALGLESGAGSGWPLEAWIEAVMLRVNGHDAYDAWRNHEIPFTSDEVRVAAQVVQDSVLAEGNVLGGRREAARTNVWDAGLCVASGECMMYLQDEYYALAYQQVGHTTGPGGDVDVFLLPAPADQGHLVVADAFYAVALSDRPEVLDVMAFMATPSFANARGGRYGTISLNLAQNRDLYGSELDRKVADIVLGASLVVPRAIDPMPDPVLMEFRSAGTEWVAGDIGLDEFLERVESAWP